MSDLEQWLVAHDMQPTIAAALEALDITTVESLCSRYEDLRADPSFPFGWHCKIKRAFALDAQRERKDAAGARPDARPSALFNAIVAEYVSLVHEWEVFNEQVSRAVEVLRLPDYLSCASADSIASLYHTIKRKHEEFRLRRLVMNLRCL